MFEYKNQAGLKKDVGLPSMDWPYSKPADPKKYTAILPTKFNFVTDTCRQRHEEVGLGMQSMFIFFIMLQHTKFDFENKNLKK